MKMKCPHCGVKGNADESLSGQVVKCPKCDQVFAVPDFAPKAPGVEEHVQEGAKEVLDAPAELQEETSLGTVHEASLEDVLAETEDGEFEPDDSVGAADLVEDDGLSEEEPDWQDSLEETFDDTPAEEHEIDISEQLFSDDDDSAVALEVPVVAQESEDSESEALPLSTEEYPDTRFDESIEENQSAVSEETVEDGHEEIELDVFPDVIEDEEYQEDAEDGSEDVADEVLEGVVEAPDESLYLDASDSGDDDDDDGEDISEPDKVEEELRAELEAMLAGTCSVCGKSVHDEDAFSEDERLYCKDCFQGEDHAGEIISEAVEGQAVASALASESLVGPEKKKSRKAEIPAYGLGKNFSIGGVLKESWRLTKGLKGSIWLGIFTMMLILFGIGAASVSLIPSAGAPAGGTAAAWVNILLQLVGTVLSMTFIAGLMNTGVRRVAGMSFSWKTVFSGFSCFSRIAIAGFLMTLLIISGFFLLILPGIYLSVGYSLTLPLVIDKNMGPWEAMEASRKAIHGRWWAVFAIYLVMYLIYLLSCIPVGIGAIWTIPMFFTVSGVLYRLFFKERVG